MAVPGVITVLRIHRTHLGPLELRAAAPRPATFRSRLPSGPGNDELPGKTLKNAIPAGVRTLAVLDSLWGTASLTPWITQAAIIS
jgi:hypothetical protein